jgi:hypothetical protein
MPFKSKSQIRFFRFAESDGKFPKGTIDKWLSHTTDAKNLPECKKPVKKKASYIPLSVFTSGCPVQEKTALAGFCSGCPVEGGLRALISVPITQKHGGLRDWIHGTHGDIKNVLYGEDGIEKLRSWNNLKGYLPGGLRDYITNTRVNPAIYRGIQNTALAGAGLVGGGLLGLYMLYRGLKRPIKPPEAVVHERDWSLGANRGALRTVNQNIGRDIFGQVPKQQ